jgi:hepatocyte growth factor-regulated tyrosine kinase substrate
MDNLVSLLKSTVSAPHLFLLATNHQTGINNDVKIKMLEEIQTWALAFEGRPHLSYVKTTCNTLKAEGSTLPRRTR